MRDMEISSSLEDYLEAIAEIIQDNEFAHTKDIAERLGVSMPSVSNALQALSLRNLIRYQPHVPVSLTRKGLELANVIRHRHQVMKCFFSDILKLDEQEADATACKIEHVLTEKSMARFLALTEAIRTRQDCRRLREFLAEQMPAIGNQAPLLSLDSSRWGRSRDNQMHGTISRSSRNALNSACCQAPWCAARAGSHSITNCCSSASKTAV